MTAAPPRPTRHAPEVKALAVAALAEDLRRWLAELGEPAEGVEESLGRAWPWPHDGYAFAKRLEAEGWGADAALVEILDGAVSRVWHAAQKAQEAWVAGCGVVIPFAVGDLVTFRERGAVVAGVVGDLRPRTAEVVVGPGGDPSFAGGGTVLPAEDVTASDRPRRRRPPDR